MHVDSQKACEFLLQGQPVALPTETVYGLAAPINDREAIEKVFQLKGRPKNNPLIVHLSSIEQLQAYTDTLEEDIYALMKAFWPGPLTVVLPVKAETIPENVTCGLSTAGFRIPNHPLTLDIISKVGPLVMPSANLSGRPSSTRADHVEADFGVDFPVVDGGECAHGLESTIVIKDHGKWLVLRQGSIPLTSLAFVLEEAPVREEAKGEEQPLCPGRLYRHYAPQARLFLDSEQIDQTRTILGFSDREYPKGYTLYSLGNSAHPEEVAARLYAALRELDQHKVASAWVDMNFPREGLWETIFERLVRASHKA